MQEATARGKNPGGLFVDWDRLGVPAWIIGPDSKICYLNRKAEGLFGVRTAAEAIGRKCGELFQLTDCKREGSCKQECPHLTRARTGETLEPRTIQIKAGGTERWVRVTPMAMTAADGRGPFVVLTATDVDRWQRIEDYIHRLAGEARQVDPVPKQLTAREEEILALLADGLSQREIANLRGVQYSTVRTHVQRILAKLCVRSIPAAVACHLLDRRSGTG